MNKNRYRVIYSQARGMFIAVAEIVKSRTKNAGQSEGHVAVEEESTISTLSYKKINPLNFAVISLLGAVIYTVPLSSIADSQIVADKSAPNSQQATILNSSNGLTQVNIQTPSAGGVSRNTYTQFDVGQEGAVLNNSRNNVQTQIGGWVQGNPWLAKGEAKVILNEVNSSNPSQLKGYLEVAGKQAQVVIANPSGLVCDGCGVINADRFTLTTGQAVMNQGYLESFRVREGQVTIEGKGLNGSLTPYTDVYARALKVNAGLYANELNTVLGQNDILVKDQVQPQVTPVSGTNNSNPSASGYALDVGQLGGMYAGKIYLVGTELGLGARNAGSINTTTGQMTLNANGDLVNTGNIIANKDQIAIQAQNVKNSGNISSTQHQIHIQANDIQNSGLVTTNDQVKLEAQGKINNNDGVINAGRIDFTAQNLSNNTGKIEQTGQQQLNIAAQNLDNSQGLIGQASQENTGTGTSSPGQPTTPTVTDPQDQSSAKDSSSVEVADSTELTPKTFEAGKIQIAYDISNISGDILNNAEISLKVQDKIKNNGGEIQLPELQFNGQNFENQAGKLTAKVINITAQNADNQKGLIDATESFDLNAQQLNNNEGRLQSTKALNLTSTQIDNSKGQILATDTLILGSEQTNNTEGVIGSVNGDVQLNIKVLNNNKGEISAQNVQLTGQTLNNQQGSIQAKTGDLTLKVDQIDNGRAQDSAGNFTAGKNLNITAQQLNSTGQIYAGDTADLAVKQLQQDGQLAALNKIKVQSHSISSSQNAIWAAGLDTEGKLSQSDATLNIDAQQAQIAGTVLSGTAIEINATKNADLSQSATQAKNIKFNTQALNTSNAKIIAEQQLDLTATQNINNQAGQYSAVQVNIDTAQLNNDQGLIQHTGQNDFILNVADRIDNNAGKIISNANTTEIKTNTLSSVAGEILHAGEQQLQITAQNLQGQQGKIQSNNNLKMDLGTANLDNATTAAQNINLTATELSHQQGQLIQSDANGQLNINVAQTLNNTSGVISAAGNTSIQTADLNNQQGVIQTLAGKDLKITSQKLDNQSGKIIAGHDVNLNVQQLNNDQGTVYADGKLELHTTQDVSNQQGLIASKQTLVVDAQNLNNQKGQIQSELGDVNLTIKQTLSNQAGSIQSANALNITAAQLENQNGQLLAGANTQINTAQLNNKSGTIYSKNQLDVNVTETADNSAGTLAAEQNLNLNAQNLLNTAGQIRSENADLIINTVQDIQNNTGLISAAKNLNLSSQNVASQQGKIQSGANAKLQVNSLDNTEGTVYATEQLQLNATGTLNNNKGVVAAEQLADLKAGSVINDAGQIRSQLDQLKLNVQNELSNLAGEISAAKNIELTANKLSNQQGKVIAGTSLNATAQQIDNTAGTLYANDQLTLNVADQLNNQSGTIAANQQVQIQAKNLNNNAGKIRSENNALDLNVQQTLDNQSGEIFASTQAKINATTVNNQQGTIYAKDQVDLTAGQLNNQQGQMYSEGSANVTVQGDVQNQKGVIVAEQSLNVQSNTLDNTEGTLRSEKADLTVNAQGQLINQQGDIYAAQNLSINSNGLVNTVGQIASQNQLSIDTQQQQLSNQNGKIIAKAVDLKTGILDNQTGLIQAEQAVKIDTQNHALINNNSGDQAGILSQGSLEIANVSQLDNISGYIAAVGSANITAQNLNNNKGQINSQADLTLQQQAAGGGIDNSAGQIQAQQNVTLNADTINNSGTGSHIVAGEALSIIANKVINAQTKDATVIAGLDGKNIEINAAELDNQSGAIRASENATLNIQNQLSNQAGSISSLDTLSIGTADKTLNVNNTGGELLAKNQLNLKANELINKGKIISEGNVDIDIKQSYTHTKDDQISANGTLKLNTDNDLINQSELTAGQKIELSAKNINNEAGASISSNETHLTAQDTVHNQGLINGELTHIQANRVWNDGARIYGTQVSIQANTLDNKSDTAGTGAVIASRGDMDLGVGTLNNQSGGVVKDTARDNAWILSAGDLNVGGSLDADLQAQGQAKTINNRSAAIESQGNMRLSAKEIQNLNDHFSVHQVLESSKFVHSYEDNRHPGIDVADLLVELEKDNGFNWLVLSDGRRLRTYNIFEYDKETYVPEVLTSSPGLIISGGDMLIQSDHVVNDQSQILAAGILKVEGTDIENKAYLSNKLIQYKNPKKWFYDSGDRSSMKYAPADETEPYTLSGLYGGNKVISTPLSNIVDQKNGTALTNASDADTPEQQTDRQQQSQQTQVEVDAGKAILAIGKMANLPNALDQIIVKSKNNQNVDPAQQQTNAVDTAKNLSTTNTNTSAITDQSDIEVRSVEQKTITLPSNALYSTSKDSQAQYLVETDPAFSNYKNWLSSDYMLSALGLDPAMQQKRLGDGFYEQKLVQDQIAQLTGRRFLLGYGNDEEQYKALMNNGLSFAQQYNLIPGVALTAAQVAQLTSDIVWLEEKTITLADGTTTKALVPQVYVRARAGDLKGDGTLISADQVQLDMTGDVLNSATIAGREALILSANNVNQLAGRMEANRIGVQTQNDLNNIGGQIVAKDSAILDIGGDLNVSSTLTSNHNIKGKTDYGFTAIDRKAGIYIGQGSNIQSAEVQKLKTTLNIKVGGNTTLKAAEILNSNGGTTLQTVGDVNIETLKTERVNNSYKNNKNYDFSTTQTDVGSQVASKGDLTITGQNISVTGSQISSEQGRTTLSAKDQLDINEGRNLSTVEHADKVKKKSFFSSKTTEIYRKDVSNESIGSTIDGKEVVLDAKNINIRGSDIVSDDLTQIQAKENVTITGAENQYLNIDDKKVKKSGLMSSGGIGFSIGSKKERTEQEQTEHTNTGSNVGSLNGNTNIIAGKTYQQTGSTVSSQQGDVNILAQQVNIEAAKEQSTSDYKHEMEQKGLTFAVNVPVVTAVQSVLDSTKQVGQSKNDRVNVMAAANAGFDAYKAGQSLGKLQGALSGAGALNQSVEVGVSLTYGEQKSKETRHSESNTASQSQVYAGGTTNIVATGAGKDSNINIIGSDVVGMKGTYLAADNDVNIKAAEQKMLEESNNKSSGWNAGVTISNQTGFGVTAGGNLGKGKGNGADTSYVNSHVGSKDSLTTISSGNATNIIGGQVQGKGVQINANELNIESLQDKAKYKSKQQNISGQVSVGTNGANVSGSFSKSNVDANYASVNEQSGIYAGDDGYQIKVNKNTDLKGSIITSTQAAENLKKNSLDTGTLTHSDIGNVSEYDAKGISLGAGFNSGKSDPKGGKAPDTVLSTPNKIDPYTSSITGVSKSIGFGLDGDKDSSVTKSGINTSNITIRDEQGQQALTGKTAEQIKSEILTNVTTDTARENSGVLKNNFDKDKVQSEINLQMDVTKRFGENAPKAVADYAQQQAFKQRLLGNEAEAKKWDEGGVYRVAMHTAIGALSTGTVEGALTTTGIAAAAPTLNQIQENMVKTLTDKGMKTDSAEAVVNGVSSLALLGAGTAAGLNTSSVGTAVNVDSNNRQLHREEVDLIQKLAKEYAKEKGISEEDANTILTRGALYNIDEGWKNSIDRSLSESEISKYQEGYQYLRAQTANTTVSDLNSDLSRTIDDKGAQKEGQLPTIKVQATKDTYAGHLTDSEIEKAKTYIDTEGKGFTATPEDFKKEDIFLTNTLAGSTDTKSPYNNYNDKKEFIQKYGAIQDNEVSTVESLGSTVNKTTGAIIGIGSGIKTGITDTLNTAWDVANGTVNFLEHPIDNTKNAIDKAVEISQNLPEIAQKIKTELDLSLEKQQATKDLYQMQKDTGKEAKSDFQITGEILGGAGIGAVGKKATTETAKALEEAIKNADDHVTPKPATVAGTPDVNGGATTMTGNPETNGGLGKTEVAGATVAVGTGENKEVISVDFEKSKIKGTPESVVVNNLKPNAKYELSNGTNFETNAHGYVEEISFTPDFKNPGKRDIRQTNLGKLGDEGDVGGHIQACVYGGTCDAYNLFPQNSNFNNSAYKVYFENIVRKAEKDSKSIGKATVMFTRNDPSSLRPDKVFVEFTIDGKKLDPVMFENKAGGGIK